MSNPSSDLVALAGDLTHDPLGFVLAAFPWGEPGPLSGRNGPQAWQRDVLDEIGQRLRAGTLATGDAVQAVVQLAVASGHGIGKSALVSWVVLWAMVTCEDTRGVITANTDNQLRTKTWPEVAKWHGLCLWKDWFTYTATALYAADAGHEKTWRIDAIPWSETNPEAFAGLHNQGKRIILIFDEASAIADKIWETAEGALTDERTEIIWCAFGNPTRSVGRFYECFNRFRHRWVTRQIDSRTVELTNKGQLQGWVDDYGENSDFVKVRVRGMFPNMSMRQFIGTQDVDAAFGRQLRPEQYEWAPKILTVDPAWEGDDEFVIGLRQGLRFDILRTIAKNDNDVHMANVIAQLEDEHQADAVFVDAGYGTGIVSVARTLGRNWVLVWFAQESADLGCLNKRAEMWKLARDWLKEGGAIPKDDVLYRDLLGPETVSRLDGKIQLESKKDMKRRGLPSPNRADALVLSFAFPVVKRDIRRGALERSTRGHDPYANLR